jgi:NADH:ubiquinone oxidoreductase subunit F (NADH-binding)
VTRSGLRGRGGAAFPTGIKWKTVLDTPADQKYIAANADEGDSGTFADRLLMEADPYQLIEGMTIAALAVGADKGFIYLRSEYPKALKVLTQAIKTAEQAKLLGANILGSGFSFHIEIRLGAGAYICGEETALIKSLEGELGMPWSKPPFPAIEGLYAKPTVVNNTETLANVPPIIVNGAEWYTSMGTEKSPGPKLMCLSGHINNPGVYEIEMGSINYHDLIYGEKYGGGIPGGKKFKALLPVGGSGPMIVEDALQAPITYEGLKPFGSDMGSGSVVVMDETVDMVWVAMKLAHFFKHESCGKCTPCREGTYWIDKLLTRINSGEGTAEDVRTLRSVASQIGGRTLCALGDFAISPVAGTYRHFADEFTAKVSGN